MATPAATERRIRSNVLGITLYNMFEVITLCAYVRNGCKNTKKLSFASRFPHLISLPQFIRGVVESKSVQNLIADWYYGFIYGASVVYNTKEAVSNKCSIQPHRNFGVFQL